MRHVCVILDNEAIDGWAVNVAIPPSTIYMTRDKVFVLCSAVVVLFCDKYYVTFFVMFNSNHSTAVT